ncbi:hypothetical protein CEUSTIGMA_g7009.t1 [Chlamydomonas eustigma]|uniref:Uncharacterized protein n=1 Tax=Chlamydomonas eustigma TaxID=1157962 RepID=A0A250X916_9CHLO|nr:hypothetical protein CEUSTIGMA_g7009.t1 [Chlamydomonas eustigma]|eukprot:GAX79568.1 hypothetical protein CEUSTIGMA_g7009.t1 [Chlamydomonas eustigma]
MRLGMQLQILEHALLQHPTLSFRRLCKFMVPCDVKVVGSRGISLNDRLPRNNVLTTRKKIVSRVGDISLSDDSRISVLAKSSGVLKNLSFCAFWAQLALTLVSAGVLLFSEAVGGVSRSGLAFNVSKGFALGAVLLSFVSTFFAFGFLRLSRALHAGKAADAGGLAANLLRSSTVNLVGIGLTAIGLQASVGTLVGKTLMASTQSSFQYGGVNSASVVSLDVFALQASTNILLCHLVGLVFSNIMQRVVNNAINSSA